MPRDGLSQYAPPPGTNGITNYTVESTKYNGFVADVTQDLNLPRPIVAGGTGANNARDAMTSLQGDVAYQVVTNYDSYPFVSGSFYSAAGATSAPTANAFIGQCYTSDPAVVPPAVPAGQNMFIEARDVTTGLKYLRQKTAGVWAAWKQQAGASTDLDAAYVNVTGDTMTGDLTIADALPSFTLNKTAAGQNNIITGATAGLSRWQMRFGNAAAESGSNAGSDFALIRYADAGTQIDAPLSISRSSGLASFAQGITAGNAGTTGTYYFGNSGTKSLTFDSANFNFNGGNLFVNGADFYAAKTATTGGYYFGNSGTKSLSYDGTNFNLLGGSLVAPGNIVCGPGGATAAGSNLVMNGGGATNGGAFISWQKNSVTKWFEGHRSAVLGGGSTSDNLIWTSVAANKAVLELDASGWVVINPFGGNLAANACALKLTCAGGGTQYGIGLQAITDGTNMMVFNNSVGTTVGSIGETSGAVTFNTSSSGELKEDLKSFDAGNIIDQTNVYDFAWKKTGERSYGVIAQQAVEVYPMAVTHSQQDGQEDDFWGVDYSKYVPVLLQELKALRTRVAQLEGRLDAKPA
jgi:hypothetical protein